MSTGYTSCIKDGITFEKFAMRCARAFGALISMRDDDSDAPIPDEFKPSTYHADALLTASEHLTVVLKMVDEVCEQEAKKEFTKKLADHNRIIREHNELRKQYEAMLEKVKAWTPPSSNHQGLKDFMIEQITSSIGFDCNNKYYEENKPVLLTAEQWKAEQIRSLAWDIDYNTKEDQKEKERTKSRTEWVRMLRDSLKVTK